MSHLSRRALALAVLPAIAGCVVAAPNPYPPIPPARYEAVPAPPGPATIWVWTPGHWHWNGTAYVWIGGRYEHRNPAWSHWVAGHWMYTYGAWRWVPGHWS